MAEDIRIVETESIVLENPIAIEGLPDVGLVGVIAATHLVEELKLKEVAHIESRLFPPVMVLHKGVLSDPVKIFGDRRLLIVTSEVAIPPQSIYMLTSTLAEWFKEKSVQLSVSISGFPVQNRIEIDHPSTYGIGNSPKAVEVLREGGVEVMEEGFAAGIYALLLKECAKRGITSIALLTQSFLNYPDPGAAASAITSLNRLLKMNVNVQPLTEKADEIRLKARDLMKQAQTSITGMQKMSEQQIPLMYR